jgi:dethiobiotin synthetase
LSIEALAKRGIKTPWVVFVDASDAPTPEEMVLENMEAVEKFSGIKVAGVIKKIDDFSNPPEYCRQIVARLAMPIEDE